MQRQIVVIACHFKDRQTFCETTYDRLNEAMIIAEDGDQIIVTGEVPYEPCGPTLGELMQAALILWGFPEDKVSVLHYGVGTFSEARIACDALRGREIVVVSSPWYLFQGKPIWQRRAKENNVEISFVSVPGTGGWRTWVTYIGLGLVVRVATLLGLEKVLEDRLTASQQGRRQGFKLDGCK